MAYSASGLTRLSGGSGVNLWHYTTTDAIADVNTAGYFNDAIGMIRSLMLSLLLHQQVVHQLLALFTQRMFRQPLLT